MKRANSRREWSTTISKATDNLSKAVWLCVRASQEIFRQTGCVEVPLLEISPQWLQNGVRLADPVCRDYHIHCIRNETDVRLLADVYSFSVKKERDIFA